MQYQYGVVKIEDWKTTNLRWERVADETGLDTQFIQVTLQGFGVMHPNVISAAIGSSAARDATRQSFEHTPSIQAGQFPGDTIRAVRDYLLTPRRKLILAESLDVASTRFVECPRPNLRFKVDEVVRANGSNRSRYAVPACDPNGGPYPIDVQIVQATANKLWNVQITIQFAIDEESLPSLTGGASLEPYHIIQSCRHAYSGSYDEQGRLLLNVTGVYKLRKDALFVREEGIPDHGPIEDVYLQVMPPAMTFGHYMRLLAVQPSFSPDGSVMTVQSVLQQTPFEISRTLIERGVRDIKVRYKHKVRLPYTDKENGQPLRQFSVAIVVPGSMDAEPASLMAVCKELTRRFLEIATAIKLGAALVADVEEDFDYEKWAAMVVSSGFWTVPFPDVNALLQNASGLVGHLRQGYAEGTNLMNLVNELPHPFETKHLGNATEELWMMPAEWTTKKHNVDMSTLTKWGWTNSHNLMSPIARGVYVLVNRPGSRMTAQSSRAVRIRFSGSTDTPNIRANDAVLSLYR